MPIERTPWIDDDGSGTKGTVLNNAEKMLLYDQIDAAIAAIGLWQATPFNAADYTASPGMAWSVAAGNVAYNRYSVIGKTLTWLVYIEAAALAGTPGNQLFVKLPPGLSGEYKRGVATTGQLYDGSSHRGWVRVNLDGLSVIVEQDPVQNFALNSGLTYLQFEIIIELN